MSLTLLLPAIAVIVALGALTVSMRSVSEELSALRQSLRRTSATAVAADDLSRTTARVQAQAHAQADDARHRLPTRPRWWNRQPAIDR